MKKLVLVLLVLALIVLPVSATIINCSFILGNKQGQPTYFAYPSTSVSSFLYTVPAGEVIAYQKFDLAWSEGTTTYFTLTKASGSTISGSFNLHSTSLITGVQTATINGGSTLTENYWRIVALPSGSAIYPKELIGIFVKSNVSSAYYFVITSEVTNINSNEYNVGAPFDLDTSRDAYITLPGNPSSDPIIQSSTINNNGGKFLVYVDHTPADSFAYSTTNANNPAATQSDIFRLFGQLAQGLLAIFAALSLLAQTFVTYILYLQIIIVFIFAAQVFLVLIAAYTIIALALSFYDSTDLFKSIGKFWHYEMKLFRFFMELYTWIVKLILLKA